MLRAQKTFSESAKRFYGFFRESPGNLIFRDGSGFFKNQFFAVCAAQGQLFSVQLKMLDRRQKLQIFLLCGHQLLRTRPSWLLRQGRKLFYRRPAYKNRNNC